jgi:hypothetical protein
MIYWNGITLLLNLDFSSLRLHFQPLYLLLLTLLGVARAPTLTLTLGVICNSTNLGKYWVLNLAIDVRYLVYY